MNDTPARYLLLVAEKSLQSKPILVVRRSWKWICKGPSWNTTPKVTNHRVALLWCRICWRIFAYWKDDYWKSIHNIKLRMSLFQLLNKFLMRLMRWSLRVPLCWKCVSCTHDTYVRMVYIVTKIISDLPYSISWCFF